jgi:hypothetical protein
MVLVMTASFVGAAFAGESKARQPQREIDALDSLAGR